VVQLGLHVQLVVLDGVLGRGPVQVNEGQRVVATLENESYRV
jgi:hypothetical protein